MTLHLQPAEVPATWKWISDSSRCNTFENHFMISLCTFQVFLSIAAFGPEMTPEILKETWKVGNPNAHEKSRD